MKVNLDFKSVTSEYNSDTILNTLQSVVVVTTRTVTLAGLFDFSPELKSAKLAISGISTFFTVRSTFNSTDKFFQNMKKRGLEGSARMINALETAIATIGIESGILGIVRSLATFKLIDLEQFSSSLGNIPVAQTLGHVTSILSIASSSISIAIESIKIHDRSKKIDRVKDKALAWAKPLELDLVQRKIEINTEKHGQILDRLNALSEEIFENQNLQTRASTDYRNQEEIHKNSKGFEKIRTWLDLRAKKSTLDVINVQLLSKEKDLNQTVSSENTTLEKLSGWISIDKKWNDLSEADNQMISQFKEDKVTKWEQKKKSLKFEQIVAGVGLGLKVVGLIVSIASLILTFTGVGFVPALATMATLSLVLALSNLGYTLFKRHTSPLKVGPALPPALGI
jgi:hypothetical protein